MDFLHALDQTEYTRSTRLELGLLSTDAAHLNMVLQSLFNQWLKQGGSPGSVGFSHSTSSPQENPKNLNWLAVLIIVKAYSVSAHTLLGPVGYEHRLKYTLSCDLIPWIKIKIKSPRSRFALQGPQLPSPELQYRAPKSHPHLELQGYQAHIFYFNRCIQLRTTDTVQSNPSFMSVQSVADGERSRSSIQVNPETLERSTTKAK